MNVYIYPFNNNKTGAMDLEKSRRGMSEGLERGKEREKYWNGYKNLKEFHKFGS